MFDSFNYEAECPFCKSVMQPVEKLTEDICIYRCDQLHINQEISVIASVGFVKSFLQKEKGELTDEERGIMLYLILNSERNVVFDIAKSGDEKIEGEIYEFVKYEQLQSMYPRTDTERIHMILENISMVYLTRVGKKVIGEKQLTLSANVTKYIFLPNNNSQVDVQSETLNTLEKNEYISKIAGSEDFPKYRFMKKACDCIGLMHE